MGTNITIETASFGLKATFKQDFVPLDTSSTDVRETTTIKLVENTNSNKQTGSKTIDFRKQEQMNALKKLNKMFGGY